MLTLGWIELIGCIVIAIGLVLFAILGETEHPTIFLRGLIIIPFGMWWGIKQIRKNKGS